MIQALPKTSFFTHPPLRSKVRLPREFHSLRVLENALRRVGDELLQPRPQVLARIMAAAQAD